ncbi:peptidylprolyl isomerase [Granulosicoccaceae sp. 1_MG-2023]|nr:peptidylprolyl isomerase [Granulosicoccaceae sp. 1_MG-2023]
MKLKHTLMAALLLGSSAAMAADVKLDGIAAVVNNDIILQSEIDNEYRFVQRQAAEAGQQLPAQTVMRQRILDKLILTKVQMQEAQKRGIRIDDETLNRAVTSIARNNGMDLPAFRQALQREGIEYTAFRNNIREELTLSRLRGQQVDAKVTVSERELDDFIARNKSSARANADFYLRHLLVAVPEGAGPEQINAAEQRINALRAQLLAGADFADLARTESDGNEALQGGVVGWRKARELPDAFASVIMRMNKGDISQPIRSGNGFHLIKVDDLREAEDTAQTETRARHILLRVEPGQDPTAAQQKMLAARQRILAGEDFARVAAEVSEDPGSKSRGGELPWFRSGEMVPQFEEVAAQLPVGTLSQPFRSNFGWHLLEVLERRDYVADPTAERNEAEALLKKARADQEFELWLRRLRADAYVEIRDAS